MKHFSGDAACLPCIWQQNCADEFVSIDARGHVAQCDCWVTSYPDYWFGNMFDDLSFTELLSRSPARQKFQARPERLVQIEGRNSNVGVSKMPAATGAGQGSCLGCDYLSICHGGCPVRTYSITGEFFIKDPYCQVYKTVFSAVEDLATKAAAARFNRLLPVRQPQ
jgi:sulfatase maturation enzyme AslB (radical SAM superfamily)